MKLLKTLLKLKISLLSLLLFTAVILGLPLFFSKGMRYYIGSSVFIVKDITEERGSGTGFIVKNSKGKRLFVTNNHVCERLEINGNILVSSDILSEDKFVLKVLKKDPKVDLCIAEAPSSLFYLPLSTSISRGDNVYVCGHPIGFPLHRTSGEAIAPLVVRMLNGVFPSAFEIIEYDAWQISAPTSPGNSGSPVVDNLGRVVGVLFATGNANAYTSFMIPASSLKDMIESL